MTIVDKIQKTLMKAEHFATAHSDVLSDISDIKLCWAIVTKFPKETTTKEFENFANKTIHDVERQIKAYYDNQIVENKKLVEEQLEGLEEGVLPDDEEWDDDLKSRVRHLVAQAQAKREHFRKQHNYKKVKRVPPRQKFDAADMAGALGMDELAKELTVDYPKPFLPTEKHDGVTYRQYPEGTKHTFDEKDIEDMGRFYNSIKNKSDLIEVDPILEQFFNRKFSNNGALERFITKNQTRQTQNSQTESNLDLVVNLEDLIGRLTVDKLRVERKLAMVHKALKEANDALNKADVQEILRIQSVDNKLDWQKEFDDAFADKKY